MPHTAITRRRSRQTDIASVKVGGDAPIVVQSMTNTDTANAASTAEQVIALARAGSQLVRVTVNNEEAAAAVPEIADRVASAGVIVPIMGTFTTTAICCWRSTRIAPGRWPSTGSTQGTSVANAATRTFAPSFSWRSTTTSPCASA